MTDNPADNRIRRKSAARLPQLGKANRRALRHGPVSEFIARVRAADEEEALRRLYSLNRNAS